MEIIGSFKSMGFDHTRHTTRVQFNQRLADLVLQGLEPMWLQIVDELAKIQIIDVQSTPWTQNELKIINDKIFNDFYPFWIAATTHLITNATFTFDDQKYVAYLDEKQKLDEGKILSGAAQYTHVMVDEFQDINPLDLNLIKTLTDRNKASLTVVGDDDQAIFF